MNTALADLPPSGGHPELSFLAGGGELGALIRGHDWADTPLGPAPAWPQSLKTAVRIMLTSRQPIWIGWGPGLTFLYNDAYKSIIGGKHPNALGRPTADVWREIWADIGPLLATAMGGVEGTYVEEQLLIMERNGYPEETYYTFSYSPIPGDDGQPGGIICANSEDTHRVVGDRQLALLRELAAETVQARSWRAACERSATALARDPHDITFALLYVIEPGQDVAELAAKVGLDPGAAGPGDRIALDAAGPWPIGSVARNHTVTVVANLEAAGLGGDRNLEPPVRAGSPPARPRQQRHRTWRRPDRGPQSLPAVRRGLQRVPQPRGGADLGRHCQRRRLRGRAPARRGPGRARPGQDRVLLQCQP